jgi:hypothetical protein
MVYLPGKVRGRGHRRFSFPPCDHYPRGNKGLSQVQAICVQAVMCSRDPDFEVKRFHDTYQRHKHERTRLKQKEQLNREETAPNDHDAFQAMYGELKSFDVMYLPGWRVEMRRLRQC